MKFEFFKSKFMYMLAESANPLFENSLNVGELTLSYNTDTKVEVSFSSGKWVCVIGICVDAYGELNTKEIADRINTFEDIEDSFAFIKRLAGKFVVIQKAKNRLYAIPDATASLPIYYSTKGKIVIASYDEIIRKFLRLEKSESALEMRKGGGYSQPFPNNITVCKEIKCVLPNSILNLTDHTVTRFLQFREKTVDRGEQEKIIQKSMDLISEITRGYSKQYSIICPLTAGRDSRLVFAFLEKTGINFECFTYTGIGVIENLEIPQAICRDKHIAHRIIDVEKAEIPYADSIRAYIGECFSDQMFNYGYTLNKRYFGKAIINGDIIDQIGKSLIGNALPYRAASTTFFMAKLHNYSSNCRDEVKRWMEQIKSGGGAERIYSIILLWIPEWQGGQLCIA